MKQLTSFKKIVSIVCIVFSVVCIVFALLSAALLITGFVLRVEESALPEEVIVAEAEEVSDAPETAEVSDAPGTAEEAPAADAEESAIGDKAIGAGIAVGLAAAAGAIGMGIAVAKTSEATARQPEAEGKLRSSLMLGLVFIETAIIYALIVAILIIFVL